MESLEVLKARVFGDVRRKTITIHVSNDTSKDERQKILKSKGKRETLLV
jgi:hypothetical protein